MNPSLIREKVDIAPGRVLGPTAGSMTSHPLAFQANDAGSIPATRFIFIMMIHASLIWICIFIP